MKQIFSLSLSVHLTFVQGVEPIWLSFSNDSFVLTKTLF